MELTNKIVQVLANKEIKVREENKNFLALARFSKENNDLNSLESHQDAVFDEPDVT